MTVFAARWPVPKTVDDIPRIETRRLILRPMSIEDYAASASMWADQRYVRYIGDRVRQPNEVWTQLQRSIGSWMLLGYGYLAIEEKASGQFLGEIGLHEAVRDMAPSIAGTPEAGWGLLPSAWGHGFATEALEGFLGWADGSSKGADLVCIIEPTHKVSIRLAENFGFKIQDRAIYNGNDILVLRRSAKNAHLPNT